jgi:hypothetical protein
MAIEDTAVPVFPDHPCQEDTMELNPFLDGLGSCHAALHQHACKEASFIAEPGLHPCHGTAQIIRTKVQNTIAGAIKFPY